MKFCYKCKSYNVVKVLDLKIKKVGICQKCIDKLLVPAMLCDLMKSGRRHYSKKFSTD